jgi:glycosyltransferase involved in cell wall biosynthesis
MKIDKPKISFLIALYNKEKYIKECINSCLNQTYNEIEICVVDDGSTDNSLSIIYDLYSTNNKVKIFSFKHNKGKVFAYNKAYDLSTGKYFALVGADDVNLENRIDVLLTKMIQENANMAYGNLIKTDESLKEIELFDGINSDISLKRILRNNFISGGASLFDKNLADYVFPISTEIKFEDWWISIISILKFKTTFVNTPVALYRLNDLNDNLISNQSLKLVVENNKRLYKRDFVIYDKLSVMLEEDNIGFREEVKRYIILNSLYKKNYIEESFFIRMNNLSQVKQFGFNRWYLETFLISFFGSKFDYFKKFFKNVL